MVRRNVVHAVASRYRDRSHFDGQNVLETGGNAPYQVKDGWMNRLLGLLPRGGKPAVAFSPGIPLALRGAVEVTSYAPSALPQADEDLMMRVEQLYAQDPLLHALWSSALEARGMAGGMGAGPNRQDSMALGRMAAGFLARADGPRIAMIETSGWDTHSGQNARLATQLRGLDGLIAGLQDGLGPVWGQTVILVATEFGRTAAANGTGGTDHGTGAVAMLVGGAVQGGRIVADWPGLAPAKPERLLERVLTLATNAGDIVLDSFAGSGTTGAVAHKMGRRWIMVELQDTCHTHIIPRLKKVIDGEDKSGITKATGWTGGGGFRYYRLAPSLLEKDKWGNWVINHDYNAAMLAQALCKLEGFSYAPSDSVYWQHGHSTERDFVYVTTASLTHEKLQQLSDEVGPDRTLLVLCTAFRARADAYPNLTVKKIPKQVLSRCEWGHDDYSLQVNNLPKAPARLGQQALFDQEVS